MEGITSRLSRHVVHQDLFSDDLDQQKIEPVFEKMHMQYFPPPNSRLIFLENKPCKRLTFHTPDILA